MIKVIKEKSVPKFEKATKGSMGYDLYNVGDDIKLPPNGTVLVSTGIRVDMTSNPNMYALVLPRSGVSLKTALRVANAPGLIDNDYQGEIKVIMHNSSYNKSEVIEKGTRIAQLMFQGMMVPISDFEIEFVDEFDTSTERGDGGFGSTGKK